MTNSLSFLPQCDRIFMIDNGTIGEIGTFAELKKKNGAFSEFVGKNLANENENNKKDDEDGIFFKFF